MFEKGTTLTKIKSEQCLDFITTDEYLEVNKRYIRKIMLEDFSVVELEVEITEMRQTKDGALIVIYQYST